MKILSFLFLLVCVFCLNSTANAQTQTPDEQSPVVLVPRAAIEACKRDAEQNRTMSSMLTSDEAEIESLRNANFEYKQLLDSMKTLLSAKQIPAEEYERLLKLQGELLERIEKILSVSRSDEAGDALYKLKKQQQEQKSKKP